MKEYDVTGEMKKVNFGATGIEEVLQNVQMILATPAFSCPMARNFAWTPDIDAPMNIMQARLTAKLVSAIQEYEPRAQVLRVSYQGEPLNGMLKPVVRVGIIDGAI